MEKSDFYFTKYPNVLLDKVMPLIGSSAFKVLSVIIRNSTGYQKTGDMISLTQFEEQTGLSRNTVLDSITELVDKKIIEKLKKHNSFWYSINEDYLEILTKNGSSNSAKKGSDSELLKVIKPNLKLVQNSNPLKKPLTENKKTTSTHSLSKDNFQKICNYWNELFGYTIDPDNQKIASQIITAMARFSVNQLKMAMFYRSESEFYRKRVPYLRSRPESFFGYPETIRNDMQRKPENVYTYKEMVHKVTTENLDMNRDFQKIDNFQLNGQPLWRLKKQNAS
ncbi:replication protein [Gracilimonas sp.]|uniref:replication protein n=1 Tax=Gracilimonas sp. TaxID=1974203 RepID=UPI003BA8EDA8